MALSQQLEDARARRARLLEAGIATQDLDREILALRRQLREGGQLLAGDALGDGRYLLVKPVGRGGFAVVWEAYDKPNHQTVAIKVLHSHLAGDPLRRERFFRGARAMMTLARPDVVRVLEPEQEDGGFHYFVMEFVSGGNLNEAVLKGRVDKTIALVLVLQVCEAVAAAHAKGMVHRDIKPSNILLDGNDDPKLTDFDLVGAVDTTGGTRTGALGTLLYSAPECLDKPQDATPRADVYGLGMTAIFCLSGQELPRSILRTPEPTIAKLSCSRALRAVLTRAVAWEPEERFADARAMGIALRAAMSRDERALALLLGIPDIDYPPPDASDDKAQRESHQIRITSASRPPAGKHVILFLAANPLGTDRLALDREARAIQLELERSSHADRFELVIRWAAEPLDLLVGLRKLRPTVVHFTGQGSEDGLYFQDPDGSPRLVSTAELQEVFLVEGSSARLVVLNAGYSDVHAEALAAHVDCVVGIRGAFMDESARNFAIGLYGGLAEGESVATAYRQGCHAISLEGLHDADRPQLKVRPGFDADQLVLIMEGRSRATEADADGLASGIPATSFRTIAGSDPTGRDDKQSDLRSGTARLADGALETAPRAGEFFHRLVHTPLRTAATDEGVMDAALWASLTAAQRTDLVLIMDGKSTGGVTVELERLEESIDPFVELVSRTGGTLHPSGAVPRKRLVISGQSLSIFQALMADQAAAPLAMRALRAIARDPSTYGREFRTSPVSSRGHTRNAVVALLGDRKLWLLWIPEPDPIEVLLLVHQP